MYTEQGVSVSAVKKAFIGVMKQIIDMFKGRCFNMRSTLIVALAVHVAHSHLLITRSHTNNFRPRDKVLARWSFAHFIFSTCRGCSVISTADVPAVKWATQWNLQRHVLPKACAGRLNPGIANFSEICSDSSLVISLKTLRGLMGTAFQKSG